MSARALRLAVAGAAPAMLAALALGAAPAQATDVEINEQSDEPSFLDINDNDNDRDVITVTISGANVVIVDTGPGGITPDGTDCTAVNAAMVTCPLDPPDDPPPAPPFEPIEFIDFDGDEGNDDFTISAPLAGSDLEGGPGDDKLIGNELDDDLEGDEGNDQIVGNGGDDSVEGEVGNDTLSGGEGDDFVDDGGFENNTGGTDALDGGPGRDTTDYGRFLAVSVSLDSVANDGFAGEGDNVIAIENIAGGNGDDTLIGDDSANSFFGGRGNDTIRSFGGRDDIAAFEGDDTVYGGAGADGISCGSGTDTAVVDPDDVFDPGGGQGGNIAIRSSELIDCERTGAEVGSTDTAAVKKGTVKVPISCPSEEAGKCKGSVKLLINGKSIGKGKFKVAPGKTKTTKVKLSKSGKKTLKRFGGEALGTAQVSTKLAGEKSVTESDVLIG